MRTRSISAAIVFIAFGIWYGYLTTHLTERTLPNTPGPSFFPWVLTICLGILSLILLFQGVTDFTPTLSPQKSPFAAKPVWALFLLFAYIVALPYLGFLIATPVFLGTFMRLLGERRPVFLVGFSLAMPAFLYFVFEEIFQILLPAGNLLG